jgi:hypothetical protein
MQAIMALTSPVDDRGNSGRGPKDATAQRLGEVLEADTSSLLAECYVLGQPPALGSLVRTNMETLALYAVVYHAETASAVAGRTPVALGRNAQTEDEIHRDQPQLTALLRTTFRARLIAHGPKATVYPYLPPQPALVHSFVYACDADEICRVTERLDYLSLLLASSDLTSPEETIAAFLRQAASLHPEPEALLTKASHILARLLGQDLPRLSAILARLN